MGLCLPSLHRVVSVWAVATALWLGARGGDGRRHFHKKQREGHADGSGGDGVGADSISTPPANSPAQPILAIAAVDRALPRPDPET
ncbi:unnamed protein product [Spirodela intermedia]|uniref:Secreted protein n=1 Tax=Spirodela intermedia TaxID=51605 RepID=A0A811G8Q1_SPIIN|nr:unnamed protein product [Spirodela intermedia]